MLGNSHVLKTNLAPLFIHFYRFTQPRVRTKDVTNNQVIETRIVFYTGIYIDFFYREQVETQIVVRTEVTVQ